MAALLFVLDTFVTPVVIAFLLRRRRLLVRLAGTAGLRLVAGGGIALSPVLVPVRRVVPLIGGLDLSAWFVLIGLQALQILLR